MSSFADCVCPEFAFAAPMIHASDLDALTGFRIASNRVCVMEMFYISLAIMIASVDLG